MSPYKTITIGDGAIRLVGTQRCGDDLGHYVFEVEIAGKAAMYGEYDLIWEPDGNSFNVNIVGFGFGDPGNVDNTHPRARQEVSLEDRNLIEKLLLVLFADREATTPVFPFTSRKAIFLGGVSFKDGWTRIRT